MCTHLIRHSLRKESRFTPAVAYVPCGRCAECRKKKAQEWEFRLNAEFLSLKKQGYNLAFCTLTYANECLPCLPKSLFNNAEDYVRVPCFSRSDVRGFIDRLRQYCKYHFHFKGADAIKYFIASEYGDITHRPHYHAILAWPSRLSYEAMHKLCSEIWTYGELFPRKPQGDYSHGKNMLPFEIVGDASKAISYCSKYASKDVAFLDEMDKYDLKRRHPLYSKCLPFHIQSRSLGFELLRNMDNDEKYKLLEQGYSFQGDGKTYACPQYIKEKLLFFPEYVKVGPRRKVYRRPTEFMEHFRKQIFQKKVDYYDRIFAQVHAKDSYRNANFTDEEVRRYIETLEELRGQCFVVRADSDFADLRLSEFAVVYHAVNPDYRFVASDDDELLQLWYNRYLPPTKWKVTPKRMSFIEGEIHDMYVDYALALNAMIHDQDIHVKEAVDSQCRKIRDFFNNYYVL